LQQQASLILVIVETRRLCSVMRENVHDSNFVQIGVRMLRHVSFFHGPRRCGCCFWTFFPTFLSERRFSSRHMNSPLISAI
jgi:hypothetical protein